MIKTINRIGREHRWVYWTSLLVCAPVALKFGFLGGLAASGIVFLIGYLMYGRGAEAAIEVDEMFASVNARLDAEEAAGRQHRADIDHNDMLAQYDTPTKKPT